MSIRLQPLRSQSGNHVAAGYNPSTQTLRVRFKNGTMYDYCGVSPEIYATALDAPSFGHFLHAVIAPSCPAAKVRPGE